MARASKVVKLPVDKAKLSVFEAWEGWKEQEARSRGQTTTGYSAIRDADQTYIPRTHTSVPSTPAMAHIDSKPIYQQPTPGAPPPSQGRYDSTQPYPRYADDRRDDRETSIKSDPQNPTSATSATTPNLPPLGFHAVNHKLPPSSSSSPNPPHPNTLPPIRPTTEHSIPVHSHPHSHPHQLPPLQHSPPHSQSRSPPTKPLPSATSLSLPTPTIPKPPSTEEITSFRRQILSNILTLLSSPTPSDIAINSLHPLISTIRPHLSSIPSQRLKTLDSTFATWTAMHGALSDFRRLTGYSGRAGDDWQAYRRGLSFRERVVVMEAENQLGTWRLERRREGLWVDEERGKDGGRGLDRELADC
ncbi:hypothetical protein B0J11DRAFT_262312 [Dendryphion nanum]|uniref:Uncharacterized protein n=1 Tax=Dendryphion nanum TaxID=256645 RepID=A0A9P9E2L9_9PLEO|nr:hypothetical protein B0J11DRAFT_262312 [Dendryphion nanum]